MAINVPNTIRPAITQLATIDDETFNAIHEALRNMPILLVTKERDAYCAPSATKPPQMREIAQAAFSLAGGRLSTELDIPHFVDEVRSATASWDDFRTNDELQDRLASRITQLLSIPSVAIGAKAATILHETDRHVVSTRIITDVRPVFDDDVISAPVTSLIFHTLRIEFHEENELRTFSVALDREDLSKLQSQITRAFAKDAILKSTLTSAGMDITNVISLPGDS